MNKILLLLAGVATVATLVSANLIKQKDCNVHEIDFHEKYLLKTKLSHAIKKINAYLLKYLYNKYPLEPHSVSGFQIYVILAQLCLQTKNRADYEKLLGILNVENVEQLRKIIPLILNWFKSDKNFVDIGFEAIANTSCDFTTSFKNSFAQLCGGKTKNRNFSNHREAEIFINKLIVKLSLNGGKCYKKLFIPKDRGTFRRMVKKYLDVTEYDKASAFLRPMCIKFTTVFGTASMINNATPYLQKCGVPLEGYKNIFSNTDANVNGITQKVNLRVIGIKKRGNIHSPKCRGNNKCMKEVIVDLPVLYWIVCDSIPVACGIYTGEK